MKLQQVREKLFKGMYPYKVHFVAKVHWDQKEGTETWMDEDDKDYIFYVEDYFNRRNPGEFVRQGAVFYFLNLDTIYMCRMMFPEKILKMEKAKPPVRKGFSKSNPYGDNEPED